MRKRKKIEVFLQEDSNDVGVSCLRTVAKYYGKDLGVDELERVRSLSLNWNSKEVIARISEEVGFRARIQSFDLNSLNSDLPIIVEWQRRTFIVVYSITRRRVHAVDPKFGKIEFTHAEFEAGFLNNKSRGTAIALEPRQNGFSNNVHSGPKGIGFIWNYYAKYQIQLTILFATLFLGSFIQILIPILTQLVVDIGIVRKDLLTVSLILLVQFLLFASKSSLAVTKDRILVHLGGRVSINMLSDFIIKLMEKPLLFFESRSTGDILQRVQDTSRIEKFMSAITLNTLFSVVTISFLGGLLAYYSVLIFGVFLLFSIIYVIWVKRFLKLLAEYDHKLFDKRAKVQNSLLEMINGIEEIKISDSAVLVRSKWEKLKIVMFNLALKVLTYFHLQYHGSEIISALRNGSIFLISSYLVIEGDLTIGSLLAIQYTVTQLNAPLSQIIAFTRTTQDAALSTNRLIQMFEEPDTPNVIKQGAGEKNKIMTKHPSPVVELRNVSFRYPNASKDALSGIDLKIYDQSTLAIVGESGGGKSTLVRLLLGLYTVDQGEILVNAEPLHKMNLAKWRRKVGVVLQNGHVFKDSLKNNIIESRSNERFDELQFINALEVANLIPLVEKLPNGVDTILDTEDQPKLSPGEQQRLLIARAVYKKPDILILDEPTSSLDSRNEKIILNNLKREFGNKTLIIVAHRLSTIRSADMIAVIDKSAICESGTHGDLIALNGVYKRLIMDQLGFDLM